MKRTRPVRNKSTSQEIVGVKRRVITKNVLKWGEKNSPDYPWRKDTSPYGILVSELLLRKTRADKVSEIFPLFIQQFPTVKELAASRPEKIREVIYSLGRLNRDAQMREIARTVMEKYAGELPRSEDDLLAIVGKQSRYTVNAIRCFAYGERVPVFDVNVNRILSRVFSTDFGMQPHKNQSAWELASMLVPGRRAKEYNWALLDLGRIVCTSDPKCTICPLVSVCEYAKSGRKRRQG